MLSMAFYQCYKTTHDLHWAPDPDFDRDIAFVRGTLDGNFGKDPNYKGEYLWYNPLLFSIETAIVKISSLPPNVVAVRAGAYLNLLAPVTFFIMAISLFGFEIALASLLSFLFLASGNILGWASATYSPRLYPVCFTQFIFYINIALCYKAFYTQKYFWFILLGASVGISFLGHAGPALLVILMMFSIQLQNILHSIRGKNYLLLKKYILQGVWASVSFIIAAMPLIYYVVGKYHLHIINRAPAEYTEGIFYLSNFKEMIKENLSVSFIISMIGFIWFYKNFQNKLMRKIIFSWLFVCIIMYAYSTLVALLEDKFHIHLPGTVPSFHYFFYLKALQSVFFGIGFIFLISQALNRIKNFNMKENNAVANRYYSNYFLVAIVLVCTFIYFPFYKNRADFTMFRQYALEKENQKDNIEVYNYILDNIPADKVILCEKDPSIFPVMATARKMVSIAYTFSSPYLDFDKRESDRNNMLLFLKTGEPGEVKKLFYDYDVSYALISEKELSEYKMLPPMLGQAILKNNTFRLFRLSK